MARRRKADHGEYRSGYEALIAADLVTRGVTFDYESLSFEYTKPSRTGFCADCDSTNICTLHTYTPDFFLPGGVIVEAKGRWDGSHRTIVKSVMKSWPDMDLRMLFQRNNPLTKKKVNTYGSWCDRQGITWAVGMVPQEWIL